ncbi:hypothetical protein MTO96_024987 [Rhipicephalus appendiculatus]
MNQSRREKERARAGPIDEKRRRCRQRQQTRHEKKGHRGDIRNADLIQEQENEDVDVAGELLVRDEGVWRKRGADDEGIADFSDGQLLLLSKFIREKTFLSERNTGCSLRREQ